MGIVCYRRRSRRRRRSRSRRLLSPISAWRRREGGRRTTWLPSSLSHTLSPSLSSSSQLHTRSPQALIARQPALPLSLSPAARRTRPFTHSRSPVATVVGGIGQRAAGRCFLSSSKLGLALPEKPSVAAALEEEEDGRRARAVERLGYLSVQVTAVRTE